MSQSDAPEALMDQTVDVVTARSYLRSLADALKTGRLSLQHDDTFLSLSPGTRTRFRLRAKSDHGLETVQWQMSCSAEEDGSTVTAAAEDDE